jgi:hypothetical protein
MSPDEEEFEFFCEGMRSQARHLIKLDFECARCGYTVRKTMTPASKVPGSEEILPTTYVINCLCVCFGFTEDREMTAESWARIVAEHNEDFFEGDQQ